MPFVHFLNGASMSHFPLSFRAKNKRSGGNETEEGGREGSASPARGAKRGARARARAKAWGGRGKTRAGV